MNIISSLSPDPIKIAYFDDTLTAGIRHIVKPTKSLIGEEDSLANFFGWLNAAVRTFKRELRENPDDFTQRALSGNTQFNLFPAYDTQKARETIESISKDLKEKPDLSFEETAQTAASILPNSRNIELNENQRAHRNLIAHIVISHIYPFTDLVKVFKNFLHSGEFANTYDLVAEHIQEKLRNLLKVEEILEFPTQARTSIVKAKPGDSFPIEELKASKKNPPPQADDTIAVEALPELTSEQKIILSTLSKMLENKTPFTFQILKDPKLQESVMQLGVLEILTQYFKDETAKADNEVTEFHRKLAVEFAGKIRLARRHPALKNLAGKNPINRAENLVDNMAWGDSKFKALGELINNALDQKDF